MEQDMKTSDLKVRVLVLKMVSRCNLDCTYCYVYNLGDTTYRDQPRVMPPEVASALFARVRSHCLRHGMDRFFFIFHGGEPMLAGPEFFERFVEEANRVLLPEVQPVFSMQTNGTLIDEAWCAHLERLGIPFGISLDGPPEVNDLHRVDHAGRGSYADVRRGLDIAVAAGSKPGLLTVIDVASDPVAIYEHFASLGIRTVDFLLPEATHDRPPKGLPGTDTPYADWLIRIFDRWFPESPVRVRIRIFEDIIAQILGAKSTIDTMGTSKNEVLVIEADGGIEPIGSLKVCGHGFTKLGANVRTHELDDALATDLARAYHLSGQILAPECRACAVHEVCGGGYLPHRYRAENGFDNPSVYCRDLMKLTTHVQNRVLDVLSPRARERLGVTRMTFEDVLGDRPRALPRRVSLPIAAG